MLLLLKPLNLLSISKQILTFLFVSLKNVTIENIISKVDDVCFLTAKKKLKLLSLLFQL